MESTIESSQLDPMKTGSINQKVSWLTIRFVDVQRGCSLIECELRGVQQTPEDVLPGSDIF